MLSRLLWVWRRRSVSWTVCGWQFVAWRHGAGREFDGDVVGVRCVVGVLLLSGRRRGWMIYGVRVPAWLLDNSGSCQICLI